MAKNNKPQDPREMSNADAAMLVISEAENMANAIAKYIQDHPRIHTCGLTVVGYAVEMLLHSSSENSNVTYETQHRAFQNHLDNAYENILELVKSSEPKAN